MSTKASRRVAKAVSLCATTKVMGVLGTQGLPRRTTRAEAGVVWLSARGNSVREIFY